MEDWRALAASPLWAELQAEGRVVATEPAELDDLPDLLAADAAGALRHERVPFLSYPYEWPFSMLKDAALLQLDLNRRALRADLTLKDASPYNVQWRGAQPVFIDVGSFERLRPDEPWAGYRQFCMLFLYPLMLQAYKDLPYHALLRGSLDGIPPSHARAVLSSSGDRFRKGVLANVVMHARLEDRYADVSGREVKQQMRRAGFNKELLDATLAKLEKVVRRPGVARGRDGVDGLRRGQQLRRRRGGGQGGLRARGRGAAAGGAGLGRRLQRRHVRAPRRRGGRRRRRARRRPRDGRRALPPPARGAAHGHPAARHVRHGPVARPRLARAGAGLARAARDAGASSSSWPWSTTCASRATSPCASCSTGCARSTPSR